MTTPKLPPSYSPATLGIAYSRDKISKVPGDVTKGEPFLCNSNQLLVIHSSVKQRTFPSHACSEPSLSGRTSFGAFYDAFGEQVNTRAKMN